MDYFETDNLNIIHNYNNFNYDPSVWGPYYWFFLHTIALNYPHYPNTITKTKYYNFYRNFSQFIPNASVAAEFDKILLQFPLSSFLDNRKMLCKWTYLVHNHINKSLEKPKISFQKFIHNYFNSYKPKKSQNKYLYYVKYFILICCLIALIVFLLYSKPLLRTGVPVGNN